jgi:hypothetical protein
VGRPAPPFGEQRLLGEAPTQAGRPAQADPARRGGEACAVTSPSRPWRRRHGKHQFFGKRSARRRATASALPR